MKTDVPSNAVGVTLLLYLENLWKQEDPEVEKLALPILTIVHGNGQETVVLIEEIEIFSVDNSKTSDAAMVATDRGIFYWAYPGNKKANQWVALKIMDQSYQSITGLKLGKD